MFPRLTSDQKGIQALLEQNEFHRGTTKGLQMLSRAYQRLGLTVEDMERAEEDFRQRVVDLGPGDV